ncbi:STAS domain-containing protein [Blastococcus haudaquaticus]|uniref:Anti-anti-sigma factor n=1 Tax=Blastococcus haudaquaticus TaxID=1938745 RepID=A0A286H532_9ACTN|nr:STAS domain-containing protein [Blastococcus haudaquaticus]SOE02566.1 anti-anti-sigma factor [Blastococcus haudaquaticus]
MPQLRAALVPAPDQVVVRLTGDADLSTAPVVTGALRRAAGLGTLQLVVDLAGARFWDCSGLHALAAFTRELAGTGRACRLVGAQPATRRLIGMANLAGVLELDGGLTPRVAPPTAVDSPTPVRRRSRRPRVPVTGDLVAAGHAR